MEVLVGIFSCFALNYFQDYGGNLMEAQSPGQCSYNCNGWPYQNCKVSLSINSIMAKKRVEDELAVSRKKFT